MEAYRLEFSVRWADLDPNRHLRHTAYYDYATHVRFRYLEERGFGRDDFIRAGLGPVILNEEARFLREVGMGERIGIDIELAAASPSVDRFTLRHEVERADGVIAAVVSVRGGWLDLAERRLRRPPEALAAAMRALPRWEDFEALGDREGR